MATDKLSIEQLTAVLEHVPVAVFVSAVDDRRLLYANQTAREMFFRADMEGAACYTIAGFDAVCPFCRIGHLDRSKLLVREYSHPVNGRVYQLSGKIIDWGREEAHIEYILDITDRKLEAELTRANEKMEDIINAIPGGVAVYKVSDIFETVYFSDGVAELSGYTVEEYRELARGDAAELTYPEDGPMVVEKLRTAIREGAVADFKFRKQHRDGHVVWVRVQARQIGEEDGLPLLQCVFHNISALEDTRRELDHLINSIPGGIASYRVENGRFIPIFFTDGTSELAGFSREDYEKLPLDDALELVYEQDRPRVRAAALAAVESGEVLDIAYRMRHKDGNLVWVRLNGRRMGPRSESSRFYAVLTNMFSDVGSLTSESADGVYVIDKDSFELLYINESRKLDAHEEICVGKTCHAAIHGFDAPCSFCTLRTYGPDEQEHEITVEKTGLVYTVRVKESIWNGIPAYIMYIRDVTEEVRARREKERLEQYFQTLVKNLPGGIAVLCRAPDGGLEAEYVSEGFAAMLRMTVKEVEETYRGNIFAGIHPEDMGGNRIKLEEFISSGEEHREYSARFKRGDGSYVWIRAHVSLLRGPDGILRLYCVCTDIDRLVAEKERMVRQYEELILQHYRTSGPDTLILGHCNITRNKILDIQDLTGSGRLKTFGRDGEAFFSGVAGLIADEEERRDFLNTYLRAPSLAAFARGDTEQVRRCFIQLPGESKGRYAEFQMNMLEAPDTGDITGILSVFDVTDRIISERILRRQSVNSHDYVVDLDLREDSYTLLSRRENASRVPPPKGCYSQRVAFMVKSAVVPRDREAYAGALAAEEIERRLRESGLYTFAYSIEDESGGIRAKNITVSSIDLRLGRVSLVCTDITDSVREQQNLLSMLAYTFELAGIINVRDGSFVMYTREMILENLPPYVSRNYRTDQERFAKAYAQGSREEAVRQFRPETMLQRLRETPAGYECVLPFRGRGEEKLQYKQINVLWGNQSHETICMVRADVTEALAAERQAKRALEKALISAEEANRAKSNFLSAMSHDIRTPMNAIMGMTALAPAHLDDREWMEDCLGKISISSKHLLSLINDVLDMSRIERDQLTLNLVPLSIHELTRHLSAMMEAQAKKAGIEFTVRTEGISHPAFYGDSLRIGQTLINLLSNAIKFTPEGGRVDFLTEELSAAGDGDRVRYRFTVSDTGIGMSEAFLKIAFEPFCRGDGVARIEGTGLGLSIVHGLVGLMGGAVSVKSRPGEGSAFQVELEFEAAPEESAQAEDIPGTAQPGGGNPFSGRRFLIAEDNALNAEILCEILKGQGAQMEVRQDGARAVEAFRESPAGTYDAVLMDIQMPNMNGYETSRAIRALERPDAKTVPIIALTANAFAEDIRAAVNAGMTAHVAKPIDIAVLQAALDRVLEQ
ncbi:MAG: PAS domain-containing protein [Clostridium sp.]|nr:PAS domain-containing protein [Clostridium sp.]